MDSTNKGYLSKYIIFNKEMILAFWLNKSLNSLIKRNNYDNYKKYFINHSWNRSSKLTIPSDKNAFHLIDQWIKMLNADCFINICYFHMSMEIHNNLFFMYWLCDKWQSLHLSQMLVRNLSNWKLPIQDQSVAFSVWESMKTKRPLFLYQDGEYYLWISKEED